MFVVFFLGSGTNQKGYRCNNPKTKRTYVTMDVTFLDLEKFYSPPVSTSSLNGEIGNKEHKWWNCNDYIEDFVKESMVSTNTSATEIVENVIMT